MARSVRFVLRFGKHLHTGRSKLLYMEFLHRNIFVHGNIVQEHVLNQSGKIHLARSYYDEIGIARGGVRAQNVVV